MTFAFIFELYTTQSIFTTFLITAGMFGALGLYGYVTKRDLSKGAAILFMALIGLILATVVNMFCRQLDALLGHHLRRRRHLRRADRLRHAEDQEDRRAGDQGETEERAAILGALSLYLDFINLFLFMLRIFGQSR